MNRENALKRYTSSWIKGGHWEDFSKDEIVNEIYDHFESKLCGSCKYLQVNNAKDMYWCTSKEGGNKYRTMDIRVDLTFGCTEWKTKE